MADVLLALTWARRDAKEADRWRLEFRHGEQDSAKSIAGLQFQILAHEDKIERELENSSPDGGLIARWESELAVFRARLRRLEERLSRRVRRGRRS